MTIDEYYNQILKLLPRGDLWADLQMFKRLFYPLAQALKYIEERMQILLREARARTAIETLIEKENDWGLPDACTGQFETITERQIALWQKMTDNGGGRGVDFIELAARLGYTITIDELSPTTTKARIGARLNDPSSWRYWRVIISSARNETYWSARATTSSRIGARLSASSRFNIECVFNRLKPAHTKIIFNYNLGV